MQSVKIKTLSMELTEEQFRELAKEMIGYQRQLDAAQLVTDEVLENYGNLSIINQSFIFHSGTQEVSEMLEEADKRRISDFKIVVRELLKTRVAAMRRDPRFDKIEQTSKNS